MDISQITGKYCALKQTGTRFIQRCCAYPIGKIKGNVITTFWGFRNFGDLITPLLLREIGYTPVNSARVSIGNFVFVGSILGAIRNDYKGVILGSGFLNDQRPKTLDNATVLGVRGEYTKKLLGIKYNVQLGDGGLLLPKFIKERPISKYKIGIIPHYWDAGDYRILQWKNRFGENARFINVLQDPQCIFHEICSCESIVSSSLHGLVVADSLGINNLWISLSDLCGNKEFKFHDYYSAFGVNRAPYIPSGEETLSELADRVVTPPEKVPDVIEEMYKIFLSLPKYIPIR